MRDMPEFQCSVPQLRMQRNPTRALEKSGRSRAAFARHNATNPRGLCCEAAPEERASISTTLNRELTHLNDSFGTPESGSDLWDEICGRAYRVQHAKNGTTYRKRCGEADTIALAFILHPPSYVTASWDEATALDFERDALESMNAVMASLDRPRIFCEQNLVGRYFHWDEGDRAASAEYAGLGLNPRDLGEGADDPHTIQGWHAHEFCMCQDPEAGRWVGKCMDAMFRTRLARDFPRLMRERGWPVLDNDVTDYSKTARQHRAKDADGHFLRHEDGSYVMEDNPDYDPEYAARRKRRAKRQGRSQNEFHSEQVAKNLMRASAQLADQNERARAENDELAARSEQARAEAERTLAEADEYATTTRAAAEQAADDIELAARYDAAGEQEAARQASDAAFDQLDAMVELREANARMAADLAAAQQVVARREDEERKADEAEARRREAERALQQARQQLDETRAAKDRADADTAASRKSAERARSDAKAATEEATKADRRRDKSLREAAEADSAAKRQHDDVMKRQKALDAGIAKRRRKLQALADDTSERQEALRGLDDDIDRCKQDLGELKRRYDEGNAELTAQRERIQAADARGTFAFRDVLAAVARAIARACERRFPGITRFLGDHLDSIGNDALNELSPETRVYRLAEISSEDDEYWTPSQARNKQRQTRPRPQVRRGPSGPSLG